MSNIQLLFHFFITTLNKMYFSWIPIWFFSPHNSIHTTKGLCLIVLYLLNVFSQYGRVIWQRRHWQPILVLLPGNCYGWRSLVGCSPWGHEESDMTEKLHFHFSLSCIGEGNGNPLQRSCLENPRDGEPGGLTSLGSHRVGHDWSDLAASAAEAGALFPARIISK